MWLLGQPTYAQTAVQAALHQAKERVESWDKILTVAPYGAAYAMLNFMENITKSYLISHCIQSWGI